MASDDVTNLSKCEIPKYSFQPVFTRDSDISIFVSKYTFASFPLVASTCWFYRPGGLPAYKGNVSTDVYGRTCNEWTDPRNKLGGATSFYTVDANYLVDGNRTAASNYCRLFLDNYWPTWCFVGNSWNNCPVPLCPNIPGQLIV